jgi:hypothetical protein
MNLLILIIFSAIPLTTFAFGPHLDSDKMNACFITINSSEEREAFKKSLSTGKNKGKFKFHEFTPKTSKDSDTWFEQACKKNIRCDILLISGHFAGRFFSDTSDISLGTDQLIKKSCDKTCENILSSPKEVFLLGCNTLADKKRDKRTPEQYLQVLLDDHFSLAHSSMIVEQRYGKYGPTYKNTMRRVFKEDHAHGVRKLVVDKRLLAPIE